MEDEEKEKQPSLEIRDAEGNEAFVIGAKGEIFWRVDGKLVQAKNDEDLGKAMALCILQLAGMDYIRLIEVYLGESSKAFRDLLIKKLLALNPKSKTIKKEELVKVISEFKI